MKPLCSFLVGLVTVCSAARLSAATVMNLNDSGPGSLRAALAADGNIEFTVTGTILLTSGQLEVNRPVLITGPGAEHLTIARSNADGTPEFRVFLVHSAPVTISGLTIKNGLVGQTYDSGAGIRNEGTLTLNDCAVRGNRSTGEYTRGTGLFNAGEASLTANRCRFSENIGSGDYAEGSGIYVFGVVNLNDSAVSGNRGEGRYSRGGGMHVDYFGRAGVSRCTFSSNSVPGISAQGGGIYNYGRLEIVNSTLSGNRAGDVGGGLHADALAPNTAIRNCTISGNTAPSGAGLGSFGQASNSSPPRTLKDSIIAGNSPGDIENAGIITSLGRNLFGLLSGTPIPPGAGDQFGLTAADLLLGPLASNGGPTPTRALLAGSPAIDAGSEAGFPTTDQRGVARPFGARPDIGAFELDVILPPLVTVSATQSKTIEAGPTVFPPPGEFTVRRSGNTNESLRVFFRLSGTASNGLDYTYVSNSVVIPAGRTSATLRITGLFDGLVEGTETVVLHLEAPECAAIYPPPPGCYIIGAPVEAVVEIQDYEHPANQPPTITLISPSNGYTSTAPANIMLIATVSDADGMVTNATVEFFSGTNKIGNGQLFDPGPPHEAPFRFYWTNVPSGEYTLTARVTDEQGATAVSDSRHVIVRTSPPLPNQPPTVTMVAPTNGADFTAPGEIQICADARDADGYVDRVEFFAGTNSLGSRTNCLPCASVQNPFCFVWTNVPPGQYSLRAAATDDKGTTTLSEPVTITVFEAVLSRVTIRATDANASEAGDPGTFTVSREGSTNSVLQVFYSIGGTAANGVDYVALSNSVLLAEGVQTATIQIVPVDDVLFEGSERVELRLLPPPFYLFPYFVDSPSNAVVTVADNDEPAPKPVVTIRAGDTAASETPSHPGYFRLLRSGPTNLTLSVYLTISGSASNGLDYAQLANVVTIPAGKTVVELMVSPLDDILVEGNETVIASLYYPPIAGPLPLPYTIGSPSNATVTILDNDEPMTNHPPVVRISTPTNEATFAAPANILICTTPSDGDDYVATVEFFAGDASLGIRTNGCIPPGCIHIGPETFCLTWSNVPPGNYTLTAKATDNHGASSVSAPVRISVLAPPPKPIVTITAGDAAASETPGHPGYFRLLRSGPTNLALSVYLTLSGLASNGLDYAQLANVVTIPAGKTVAELIVSPVDDNLLEGNETVIATLYASPAGSGLPYTIGSPSNAVVTILDNDSSVPPIEPAVVTIEATDPQARETGLLTVLDPGVFTIRRTGNTNPMLHVQCIMGGTASNGVDYISLSNIVIIPSGVTSVQVPVYPLNDNLAEGTETVTLHLQNPACITIYPPPPECYQVGAPGGATVYITDGTESNALPVVTITASDPIASEGTNCVRWVGWSNPPPANFCGTNTATFVVRRTGSTNASLSVNYEIGGTASNGVDYAALPGIVTIPAGSRAAEIKILPVDDMVPENTETLVLALTARPVSPGSVATYVIGSPRRAGAMIVDNDQPRPTTGPLPDRGFHLMHPGTNGTWFRIECSTNLIHWTALCTNVVTDGAIHFVDADAATSLSRFYRAVAEPNPLEELERRSPIHPVSTRAQ